MTVIAIGILCGAHIGEHGPALSSDQRPRGTGSLTSGEERAGCIVMKVETDSGGQLFKSVIGIQSGPRDGGLTARAPAERLVELADVRGKPQTCRIAAASS